MNYREKKTIRKVSKGRIVADSCEMLQLVDCILATLPGDKSSFNS